MADKSGFSSNFLLDNFDEVNTFVADPSEVGPEPPTTPEEKKFEQPQLWSSESERQTFFQKAFGTDLRDRLPLGYEQMSGPKRAFFRGNAMAHNLLTRTGGRGLQTLGIVDLKKDESLQEFDGLRASWELSELSKKASKGLLSTDELNRKEFLEAKALRWYQKGPEFAGVVGGFAVAGAVTSELMAATGLGATLDAVGRKSVMRLMPKFMDKVFTYSDTTNAGHGLLASVIEQSPRVLAELFTFGVIATEGEDGPATIQERARQGAVMTAWLPVAFIGEAVGATGIKPPQKIVSLYEAAVANTAVAWSKIASPFRKAAYTKDLFKNFERAYQAEFNAPVPKELATEAKDVFRGIVNRATTAAKEGADDIFGVADDAFAASRAAKTIGHEKAIPQRSVTEVMDDAIQQVSDEVSEKTGVFAFKNKDGTYGILNAETQQEIAVGIEAKNLGVELEAAVLAKAGKGRTIRVRTKMTITEEAELRKTIRQLNATANKAYRSGVTAATEKAALKIEAGRERIASIRQGFGDQLERQMSAKKLVKDYVPVTDQGKFINRIIKSRTGDEKIGAILDDIEKHLDLSRIKASTASLRNTFKEVQSKFGKDLSQAPDDIQPVLRSLFNGIDVSHLRDPKVIDDLSGLSNEFRKLAANTQGVLSDAARFEIPEVVLENMTRISKKTTLSATDVQFVDDITKLILHRTSVENKIFVEGQWQAAQGVVADTAARIRPRSVKQQKLGAPKKTAIDIIGVDSDHPVTLITRMAGKDSELMKTYNQLFEGESVTAGIERTGIKMWHDHMNRNGITPDVLDGLSKEVAVRFGGQKFKITRDELLSLGMFLRDPYNFEQLLKAEGLQIRGQVIRSEFLDDIFAEVAKLTDRELTVGSVFFDTNNKYLAPLVNQRSLQLNGAKLATTPQNYPMHRVRPTQAKGRAFSQASVETQSRMMPRTGSSQVIKIRPFTTEYLDNLQQVARYNGMSIPIRNIRTVLNDKGLTNQLIDAGYAKERDNLIEILTRSEGMFTDVSMVESLGSSFLNKFSAGILAGRISTVGTQISSVPAFYSEIPAKFFAPQVITRNDVKEMEALSDFLWSRWNNRRMSIEMGNIAAESSVKRHLINPGKLSIFQQSPTERALQPMVWGDQQAIGQGFQAAKRMMRAQGVTESDVPLRAIEVLENATRFTQPNWNVSTRSRFATDVGLFKRLTSMFRTAQEAQFNIIKRANSEFARNKQVGPLVRDYTAVGQSVLSVALWRNLSRKARVAGIVGLSGWLGHHVTQKEEDLASKIGKDTGKTALGLMPFGQYMSEVIDVTAGSFIDGYDYKGYSRDPITTFTDMAGQTRDEVAFIFEKLQDGGPIGTNRYGLPVEKKMQDISAGDVAKKVILPALKLTSLATGNVGAAPIDEWVYPALRQSQHKAVKLVGDLSADNAVQTQRNMETFLNEWARLTEKERTKGLNKEEADKVLNMSVTKSFIDSFVKFEDLSFVELIEKDLRNFKK